MVICSERGADCLPMVQLVPLPSPNPVISVALFKSNSGFTFLVPAYPGCPGKESSRGIGQSAIDSQRHWSRSKFLVKIFSCVSDFPQIDINWFRLRYWKIYKVDMV